MEKDIIDFVGFDSLDILMGTNSEILEVRLQATTDRWVNEIDRLIVKAPRMVYCKYCGAKNKSTETKYVHCGALMS